MFGLFKNRQQEPKQEQTATRSHSKNPHRGYSAQRNFFDPTAEALMPGWTVQSVSIDQHLQQSLVKMRARSRQLAMQNPYGRKYMGLLKTNIVGPKGVIADPQVKRNETELDDQANDAITKAFLDWSKNYADIAGALSFIEMQGLAVGNLPTDGEYIFEEIRGRKAGKYGYALKVIDPALLDSERNQTERNGNVTRLGIEKDADGRPVRYYFREVDAFGNYQAGRVIAKEAKSIIHGFMSDYPDQSRGIPWMQTGIFRMQMLEGYDTAALTAARAGASKMGFFESEPGDQYEGEGGEGGSGDGEGAGDDGPTTTSFDPGTMEDIGNRKFVPFDPAYPNEQYTPFIEQQLHSISSGWGVSYASLSNNLKGVNYSSIRSGVIDDREMFKCFQEWLIRTLISRVYQSWLEMAYLSNQIIVGKRRPLSRPLDDYRAVKFQPKRWAWVDPLKDMQANVMGIQNGLLSPMNVIADQGGDPEKVLQDIAKFNRMAEDLGINLSKETPKKGVTKNDNQDEDEDENEDEDEADDDK